MGLIEWFKTRINRKPSCDKVIEPKMKDESEANKVLENKGDSATIVVENTRMSVRDILAVAEKKEKERREELRKTQPSRKTYDSSFKGSNPHVKKTSSVNRSSGVSSPIHKTSNVSNVYDNSSSYGMGANTGLSPASSCNTGSNTPSHDSSSPSCGGID